MEGEVIEISRANSREAKYFLGNTNNKNITDILMTQLITLKLTHPVNNTINYIGLFWFQLSYDT
ncbi:hypothetical protein GCM10027566_27790 [Arachidicoccus ginsenosidivorans]